MGAGAAKHRAEARSAAPRAGFLRNIRSRHEPPVSVAGILAEPERFRDLDALRERGSRTLGEAVGAEITRLRVDRAWSQAKLAHDLGYTERYVGQLERGTKSPTLRTLADLAKAFSVEVSAIIRSAERRHRNSGKR